MALYTAGGERLYVNPSERQRFIAKAMLQPPLPRSFCLMLVHTGCRLSEARRLRRVDLQLAEQLVSFATLKRRGARAIREVPISKLFAHDLELAHFNDLSSARSYLWGETNAPPPRSKTYRWVKSVMREAGIEGPQACPKGLRHGFGVHATRRGVQLHMLQKWMGHASMETTAIYATAFGPEEREIAERMWR